jgi:hypothetical protein
MVYESYHGRSSAFPIGPDMNCERYPSLGQPLLTNSVSPIGPQPRAKGLRPSIRS